MIFVYNSFCQLTYLKNFTILRERDQINEWSQVLPDALLAKFSNSFTAQTPTSKHRCFSINPWPDLPEF